MKNMNMKHLSLSLFVVLCLVIEIVSLAYLYEPIRFEDGNAPLFSGNIYTAYNNGFSYHAYERTSKTLIVTAITSEKSSERWKKYNENKAMFEVFENVHGSLDNNTILHVAYTRNNFDPANSAIHIYLWVTNGTGRTEINYVIGFKEADFSAGQNFVTFQNLDLNSEGISLHPWQALVPINRTQEGALQIFRIGIRLIDYSWEGPGQLSLTAKIDLQKSYLLTSYGRGVTVALHDYRIQLSHLSIIVGAAFLSSFALVILLRDRLRSQMRERTGEP